MRADIYTHWKKIVHWVYDQNPKYGHADIWSMLEKEYGARRVIYGKFGGKLGKSKSFMVEFPDEKTYTWFLLRWS